MPRITQQSKIIITLLIIISAATAFALAGIESPEAAMRKKLTGAGYDIEFENSFLDRDRFYEFTDIHISFGEDNTLKLPGVCATTYERYSDEEADRKARGAWKIISTNPDSVFFDVPEHTFHGKYAVRFFVDNNGWVRMNLPRGILKIELKNDSTLLTCNRNVIFFNEDLWDWENNSWKLWPE
ncbi:MAG: hypothetical protein LBK45_06995 [Tannerellaceae bacterium]|jgi:hypothetical protein|nr:hypothetical protein [Tannerellaceae bacterium]